MKSEYKIEDWMTHISNLEDAVYLRTKLPDVNIRLFNANPKYREIIAKCCEHVRFASLVKMDGYSLPYGTSGANVGIPFNIISVVVNRGESCSGGWVMMNPTIVRRWGGQFETFSNCGSIRLPKKIKVMRDVNIEFEWWDQRGYRQVSIACPKTHSATIQHEIDHNLGILITDREVK
jgi:peptide deformylase